ncbi:hypothetical protein I6F35_14020 [Bradyrhizobium sp. BRP22]|uniref:hypothetical protein n=1 Tax=Bradyrhizobium sp. BRP22 TaxID=2793821 RepID=UPI001CD22536|nr:hypothetical protein [Bradyrhizobium sp. BRP22]MCA1454325.1 hypothetical protein [Bradyrhizobium sp. BRP22]
MTSGARVTGDTARIGVVLPDGAMISARLLADRRWPPFLGGPWMMTLLFMVISSRRSGCGRHAR